MALGQIVEPALPSKREKHEIFSAIFVIVLIPTVIMVAAWLVLAAQRDFARSTMSSFAASTAKTSERVLSPELDNPAQLEQIAAQLVDEDLVRIMVLKPVGDRGNLQVVTSTDPSFDSSLPAESIYRLANSEQRTITRELAQLPGTGLLWQGVTPVIEDGKAIAFINSTVVVEDIAQYSDDFAARLILISTALVIAVIFLLAAHFRILDYAELIQQKKQNESLRRDLLKVVGGDVHKAVTALNKDLGKLEQTKSPAVRRQAIADLESKTQELSKDLSLWRAVREVEDGDVKYQLKHVSLPKLLEQVADRNQIVKLDIPSGDHFVNVDKKHLLKSIELVIDTIKDDKPRSIEVGYRDHGSSVELILERLHSTHPGDPRLIIARYHVDGMGGSFRRARHGDICISLPVVANR